ncbi:hypothetical protein BEN49_22375 [Hymenobacter coccineus]|uniref:SMP-30/Gluconolactonase/LRE-like region domain-containing protein n=1 Tax=Hymenobacter coccineus TaxID=1908235 RepID=A0A1G1TI84_9BACT|nr:hypothetical protein BEN49_22375 [Hymenobacter coccineus]
MPSPSAAAYESAAVVTTLAGADAKGSTDGPGAVARFGRLMGIAVAADGALYLADEENSTIRKVTPTGEVTTLAGTAGAKGSADGPGAAARFYHPIGVAVDASGTLYVTDADNQIIRKITAAGDVTTLAGSVGHKGSADGVGGAAKFNLPHSLAVAADGTVYVADTYNHTIRKITPAGVVTTLAGSAGHKGSTDGTGDVARFYHPAGVAVDAQGTLYVADHGNQLIRKISPAGDVTTLAGTANQRGYANGRGADARFRYPGGLAVDADGTLYVTDYMNMTIRKVTAAGEVTTLAGMVLLSGQVDGPGPAARFDSPWGVAVGAGGELYVAESNTIRVVK